MKTMVIKADDVIVERIVSLFDLFPKERYELAVMPYTEEEREIDELAHRLNFDDDDQIMEFCVKLSDLGKRQWWSTHDKKYLEGVIREDRH